MLQFDNVNVVKQANLYFDGKVSSRTVNFPDGSKKTLGIAMPGEYEFGTGLKEEMEILAGSLDVLLPGETAWRQIDAPATFTVASNSKFQMKVHTIVDYCCSYLAE